VVEHLPSKCEALNSKASTADKEREKKSEEVEGLGLEVPECHFCYIQWSKQVIRPAHIQGERK
jgi:hypothetical protein